ncbi:zinc finger CCCH domain-containing protein 62-like [Glycine soja]|uniref:zinc finger CCCH domain-containing protein 62-like n=1 Tax=Glycine soja TaxID=3848 RepID=UPI001038DA8E|nr:zinc finger CCCH domain-containing protein 62-like [Glycine soja]
MKRVSFIKDDQIFTSGAARNHHRIRLGLRLGRFGRRPRFPLARRNSASSQTSHLSTRQKRVGRLEKLKVDECKLYPRKNGLRLTGNKDTLIQRIKKHLEILNGGVKKYPPSSFVLNCKELDFPASGPPCGKRIGAGHIVQESYGATKQQHTFPIWEDESQRQKILMEKHSRGSLAREDREARIQEKEKRKKTKENRISKKDSVRNQSHSQITRPQYQPQKTNVPINPEKPEFPSQIQVYLPT